MIPQTKKCVTETDRMIGNRVATFRIAHGLSQTALGRAIGVSYQQVQKYERGLNRIGAGRLQAIAALLKTPVETFFVDQTAFDEREIYHRTSHYESQVLELTIAFRNITDEAMRDSVISMVKAVATIHTNPLA